VRLGLVGLLVPALLVTACGSQVKQGAVTGTPTPTGIAFPEVTATATPAAFDQPTPTATVSASPGGRGTSSARASATPSASPSDTTALGRDPLLLVGWWRVATPAGELDLGLGEDGFVVHPCGESNVGWAASPTGLFVASGYGGDGSCYEQPPRPDLTWLESAGAFAVSKDHLLLVDGAGTPVARGVREQPPGDRKPFALTPALRTRLADSTQLPQGVRPITAKQLQRRWVPKGNDAGNGKAYVVFAKDRLWSGSDGCNGAGGRYSFGDFGELLTTTGPQTLIGCDTSPAPDWVSRARRLGLVDGALAVYDAKAVLLGGLYRG
jgi:hypothetical protein